MERNSNQKPKVLVVDDDESIRLSLKWALSQDYNLLMASNRTEALKIVDRENPMLVTLDLGLPPDPNGTEEGFRTLTEIIGKNPFSKVIIITGQDEKHHAIHAVGQGAHDFFPKPIEIEELKIILKRATHVLRLEEEHRNAEKILLDEAYGQIIGTSTQIKQVLAKIEKVAQSDVPVLILGESGTGKELVATAIHQRSLYGSGPFIPINCGAIPENLLESELFGHEKGSFTGAHAQRKGRIEMAECGTLFLDEIGELPLALQVKLLRFLQEHKLERLGGRKEIFVNTRIIAATNKDLSLEVQEKRFREDLYYRLAVITVGIPPLRERGEDVVLLATSFLRRYALMNKCKILGFTKEALLALEGYEWPGNVRELENCIKRAAIMTSSSKVCEEDLQLGKPVEGATITTLKEARENLERCIVVRSLIRHNMNMTRVASELGISRPTLYEMIEKLGINKHQLDSKGV